MRIEDRIQQKAFKNEYLKTHINIMYSYSWFRTMISNWLIPFQISWQQFNILRILRGKRPESATVKEVTGKMIDKMSNTSRLVEKMKQKGLVNRVMDKNDRRKMNITITEKGLDILDETSRIIEDGLMEAMQNISVTEAKLINDMLDKLRR